MPHKSDGAYDKSVRAFGDPKRVVRSKVTRLKGVKIQVVALWKPPESVFVINRLNAVLNLESVCRIGAANEIRHGRARVYLPPFQLIARKLPQMLLSNRFESWGRVEQG